MAPVVVQWERLLGPVTASSGDDEKEASTGGGNASSSTCTTSGTSVPESGSSPGQDETVACLL